MKLYNPFKRQDPRQIANAAVERFVYELGTLDPKTVKEAFFSSADLSLALEDRGWIQLGKLTQDGSPPPLLRKEIVIRARHAYQHDPLAKQAIRLWTSYTFGQGITLKAKQAKAQTALDAMWKDKANRKIFKPLAQHLSSNKLLVDGEVFFALFLRGKSLVVRRIDPLEIEQIYSDPEDSERPLFYERVRLQENGQAQMLFYRDLSLADELNIPEVKDGKGSPINDRVEPDVLVYHVMLDPVGKRGTSLLMPVIDWTNDHRDFMTARVKLAIALQRFAQKISVIGSAGAVAQVRKKFSTDYNSGAGGLTIPGDEKVPAGSTFVGNQNADIQNMEPRTGASGARDDGDMIKLMVCAGTGIFLHYMGDPSTGNLATSTAMELPMLKMFQNYQQLWSDAYSEIINAQWNVAEIGQDEAARELDVDFPPIVEQNHTTFASSVQIYDGVIPGFAKDEAVMQQILQGLGINNVDQVLKRILAAVDQNTPTMPVAIPGASQPFQHLAAALESLQKAIQEGE